MNQVRVEDGLAIADRAVAMALEAGAEQAEALVMHTRSALTRFANNEIHQNVAEEDTVVNLRVIDGYRVGVASANRRTDEDLGRLAASATATARPAGTAGRGHVAAAGATHATRRRCLRRG